MGLLYGSRLQHRCQTPSSRTTVLPLPGTLRSQLSAFEWVVIVVSFVVNLVTLASTIRLRSEMFGPSEQDDPEFRGSLLDGDELPRPIRTAFSGLIRTVFGPSS